jgi:pimeloyl-ACP methyl ester carboxylesterase
LKGVLFSFCAEVAMSRRSDEVFPIPLVTGGSLQAYLSYTGEPSDWAVVYVHGFGSTRTGTKAEAVEAACARRGWTFAAFDFRGHGKSSGTLLELRGSGLLEDLAGLRDALAGRGVNRLCLVGSSMGGWAAAWFAVRHPGSVVGCVLLAPAIDFLRYRWTSLTESERTAWKRTGRLRVQNEWIDVELGYSATEEIDLFPAESLAAQQARPVLIFHGMRDEVIPYAQSLAFVEAAGYPDIELRLYKNGDHRLLAYKDEMAEAACAFFARVMPER